MRGGKHVYLIRLGGVLNIRLQGPTRIHASSSKLGLRKYHNIVQYTFRCALHVCIQLANSCIARLLRPVLAPPLPVPQLAMAGYYSFDAWSSADIELFENHYNIALAKSDGQEAKLVGDFDVMKGLAIKYGAAEIQTLPPHLVGIFPDNRDRKLMHAVEMASKGCKIVQVGASRDLCGPLRAWCVQDSEARESYNWTVKTAASSDAFAVPSASVAYGSVGCSHFNQFLCAVNQARPTNMEFLKDKVGNINKNKIFNEDHTFASLATSGLDWYVLKRGFVAKYEHVPRLFSKALNAEHNIAVGETWDQQFSSICASAQLMVDGDGDVPWPQVTKHIASSQGPHVADLPVHVQFIKKYGGGASLSYVLDTLAYFNLRMPAGRKVSGHWIKLLTSIPLTTDFAVPRLVHAIFKCHACCDDSDCEDSLARKVTVPEMKGVFGKGATKALQAEQVLGRMKKVFDETNRSTTLEYGDLSIKIAEAVLGKTDDTISDCLRTQSPSDSDCIQKETPTVCSVREDTQYRMSRMFGPCLRFWFDELSRSFACVDSKRFQ